MTPECPTGLLVKLQIITLNHFCTAITCPVLSAPTNGNAPNCTNSNSFESVCAFKCSKGFGIVGSSSLTCGGDGLSINGTYDSAVPTCEG